MSVRWLSLVAVVRPPAPHMITSNETGVAAWLSDAGKAAWDRGEDLDFNKGHFTGMGDLRRLAQAEF